MKKNLLLALAICAVASCATVFAVGCHKKNSSHTQHSFTEQVAETKYLKSKATCTDKAVYYYSCSCGEEGTETFEYGEALGHSFDKQNASEKFLRNEVACTDKAVYYYSCSCGEMGTDTFEYGEPKGHTFNQQNIMLKYLKSEANCTENAKFYYSCSCGEMGTETFYYVNDNSEYGKPKGHNYFDGLCLNCGDVRVTEDLDYQLNSDGTAYTVAGIGLTTDRHIKIASTYGEDNLPVTEIGYSAFYAHSELRSIILPNSVTNIDDQAFRNCSGLTGITIPDNVTNIGEFAFAGCSGLKSIEIPNSVTGIGYRAFDECRGLTNIIIPSCVTSIGEGAFSRCNKLEAITVDADNLNYISVNNCLLTKDGQTLIAGCKNSIIPYGVASISAYAFYDCSELKSIIIPSSVTSIALYAFSSCSGLKSIIIPNSVTIIDQFALGCGLGVTIYCEAVEKPEGWNNMWNFSSGSVIWGYKGED